MGAVDIYMTRSIRDGVKPRHVPARTTSQFRPFRSELFLSAARMAEFFPVREINVRVNDKATDAGVHGRDSQIVPIRAGPAK